MLFHPGALETSRPADQVTRHQHARSKEYHGCLAITARTITTTHHGQREQMLAQPLSGCSGKVEHGKPNPFEQMRLGPVRPCCAASADHALLITTHDPCVAYGKGSVNMTACPPFCFLRVRAGTGAALSSKLLLGVVGASFASARKNCERRLHHRISKRICMVTRERSRCVLCPLNRVKQIS